MQSWAIPLIYFKNTRFVGIGEPKVYYFKGAVEVNEQVFWLEIAMNYAELMQMLNSIQELTEELTCFLFLEPFLFDDELKQLAFWDVLHD